MPSRAQYTGGQEPLNRHKPSDSSRRISEVGPPTPRCSGDDRRCLDAHTCTLFRPAHFCVLDSNPLKQNITLKLPTETLRQAKVMAAQRGTSLSALLLEKLQDALGDDASYEAARKRAFKALDTGWPLGGPAKRDRSRA